MSQEDTDVLRLGDWIVLLPAKQVCECVRAWVRVVQLTVKLSAPSLWPSPNVSEDLFCFEKWPVSIFISILSKTWLSSYNPMPVLNLPVFFLLHCQLGAVLHNKNEVQDNFMDLFVLKILRPAITVTQLASKLLELGNYATLVPSGW